jgi:hypothetical protein
MFPSALIVRSWSINREFHFVPGLDNDASLYSGKQTIPSRVPLTVCRFDTPKILSAFSPHTVPLAPSVARKPPLGNTFRLI